MLVQHKPANKDKQDTILLAFIMTHHFDGNIVLPAWTYDQRAMRPYLGFAPHFQRTLRVAGQMQGLGREGKINAFFIKPAQ